MKKLFLIAGLMLASLALAAEKTGFETGDALDAWQTQGEVTLDTDRSHSGDASLKLAPGAKAVWKLREESASGKVEMWVYEDGSVPTNPKKRQHGPMWGLLQAAAPILTLGPIYAPYLRGDTTYAVADWNPAKKEHPWFSVQYLGLRRKTGWHKWTFEMDPEEGLKIFYDGRNVNARRRRFKWFKTDIAGFTGIVIYGDTTDAEQPVWIDDLTIDLGGEMKKEPRLLPETDPAPEKPVRLQENVRGVHPRLLFSSEDVPELRELARGEGKVFFEQLKEYMTVSRAPDHTKFLKNATDGQRQGLWRMPTAAVHYVITGEKKSFQQARSFLDMLIDLENWEKGGETDSGMSAANIMIGAAIVFDCLHDDLEPEFREAFRNKLLDQARKMYYRGHLHRAGGPGYWKQDPQNNHRWHRNAGLTLCALAAADPERTDDDWILAKTLEELRFIAKWLPQDGTSHESPSYMVFGAGHLTLAMDASDRCLGTEFLSQPFFENLPAYRLHTLTPGFTDVFCYGDCGGFGSYSNFLFRCVAEHDLEDHFDGVMRFFEKRKKPFWLGWWSLIWHDPTLPRGDISNLPLARFFPDLGLGIMRDGWEASDVGVMLKCGPYGGHRLQEYHEETGKYINVAHDDPDANSFLLYARGEMLADYDPYAKPKLTSSHNTILVNGEGQHHRGKGWTQPLRGVDMKEMATAPTWKVTDGAVVMEGEAGNAYEGLTRYRRTLVWVPGSYVLVLDDIRSPEESEITWLVQSHGTEIVDAESGHYRLAAEEGATCDFHMASNAPVTAEITTSTANHRGKKVGYKQLQATAKTAAWRGATVFDTWQKGDLRVKLESGDGAETTITVTAPGIEDTWTWTPAPDLQTPTTLKGTRGEQAIIEVTPTDTAPQP